MDIIRDILTRVQEGLMQRMGLPDEVIDLLTLVDRDIRREYGGERPYIQKTCEADIASTARRNNAIRRAWRDGEPQSLLADRYCITQAMVSKITRGKA